MKPALNGNLRAIAEWLAVALICALGAAAVTQFGWLWRIDQAFYDVTTANMPGKLDSDLLIVAIDDRSMLELGHWPWSRRTHAALLRRLKAAAAGPVALDVLFPAPDHDDPQADDELATAIHAYGRVALPVTPALRSGAAAAGAGEDRFTRAAAAVAHAQVEFDPDGVVRSVYLWEGPGEHPYPQLGLALLGLADPAAAARYPPKAGTAGEWVRSGWLKIPFARPPGGHQRVSYVDVLKGRVADAFLRGRPVLVGAVAAGMGDQLPSPVSALGRPMAGVGVHANVYSALRQNLAVEAMPLGIVSLIAAGVVLALMFAVIRLTPRRSLVAAIGVSSGVVGLSWILLTRFQVWLPPAGALLGCAFVYPLWSWRRLEATQRYLDEELAALQREARRWRSAPAGAEPGDRESDPIYDRLAVLRETASRQRQLRHFMIDTLDGLPTGVVVIDPEGQVPLHNRRAADLLGSEDAAGIPAALRRIEWPAEIRLRHGIPQGAGEPVSVEVQATGQRTLHVTIAALHDRRSRMHGVVLTMDDITAVKEAQSRREAAMHYLSHDLRAPLSSIVTMVESGTGGLEEGHGEIRGALERIGLYARSALELTENLFRLVRAEGVDARSFTIFDLSQIADDAAEEAWALARAKRIRVDAGQRSDDECPVLCEPSLLKRAVLNLLTNAIKYSPENSEIRLRIEREPRGWRLEVHDEGEGIRPEDQSLLFQRFGRLEKSSGRRVAGLGLGLMIVKTVVERHGGTVDVVSEPGVGSIFSLHLPLARQ